MTLCRATSYRYGGGQCWHQCSILFFKNILRRHRLGYFLVESAFTPEYLLRHYAKWAFIQGKPNSVMVGSNFVQHLFTSVSILKALLTISLINIQWLSRRHWINIFPFYLHIYSMYIRSNETRDREQNTVRSKLGHSLDYDCVFLFSCSRTDKRSIQKYIQCVDNVK